MRKIISKHEEEKKSRKRQFIAGGVLIFIMISSIIGYAFIRNPSSNENEKIIYNGIEFVKQNDFWFADISNLQFGFSYNPEETENIPSSVFLTLNNYYSKPLYIYSDSGNYNAEMEIYRNLDQIILRRQYACPEGENCTETWPEKTCENNFIIIEESENLSVGITQEDNCIFIKGNEEEIVKATDKFLFEIIGV